MNHWRPPIGSARLQEEEKKKKKTTFFSFASIISQNWALKILLWGWLLWFTALTSQSSFDGQTWVLRDHWVHCAHCTPVADRKGDSTGARSTHARCSRSGIVSAEWDDVRVGQGSSKREPVVLSNLAKSRGPKAGRGKGRGCGWRRGRDPWPEQLQKDWQPGWDYVTWRASLESPEFLSSSAA